MNGKLWVQNEYSGIFFRFWREYFLIEVLKLKFDQDLCKNLWYEFNPRVRRAFGNVYSTFSCCNKQSQHHHETLHLFRHFVLGDIWQLPIERNTTDSTDKRDRIVRTVMAVRTDMRNMVDICARQLLQVLRCYTFCQPSGNPTEWESSGLTGYKASNRQVWLIVAHFTRSPPS